MQTQSRKTSTAALALAALGVVYGDIGTSPLYTVKEVFSPHAGAVALDTANIVGVTSSIFWLLMVVVSFKYVALVLRADNRGEGGVMALLALASGTVKSRPRLRRALVVVGAFGACLFYGDSVLTPAISVLSAVEGLQVFSPNLKAWVLPLATGVLIGLFLVQRHGTAKVGRWFGPIVVLWFVVLAGVGLWQIVQAPQILHALDPRHALRFLAAQGSGLFLAVGALVLTVTGAEALYADMGHFGRRAIRLAWTALVFPALSINYLGQGALLLSNPAAVENPFYRMFPAALLLPAVILATAATIIASQAVISGAYSITQQAIQLGFLPRMRIIHTSAQERGQIYLPTVNWLLLLAVVLVCIGFGSSSAMASAYGIAVTATMLITTLLTWFVVRHAWGYPAWLTACATLAFAALDAVLLAACSAKLLHGGWFPLLLAALILLLMLTWKRGRSLLLHELRANQPKLPQFITALQHDQHLHRIPRTAVYLVAEPGLVPQALLHNLKHNMGLHERNLILTVHTCDVPWINDAARLHLTELGHGFWQGELDFGFMQQPDVPQALALAAASGLDIDPFATSYFLGRETVIPTSSRPGMALWRERLFATMSLNAGRAVDYFCIPHNAVIEVGTRVQI